VEYGTTSEYGSISTMDTEPLTSHSVVIEGLQPKTIYHIQVTSTDASGNEAASGDSNFTTLDTTPPVISHVRATVLPGRGADITWATDEESTSQVEFGTTGDFGSLSTLATKLVTSHSTSLGGLLSDTPYHFRVRSKDASGNQAISEGRIFTSPDSTAPQISRLESSVIAPGTINIRWTTDENATTQVEYGTTSNYGSLSSLDTDLETDHSARITKLQIGATYHYRVKSADASGNIGQSEDLTIIVSLPSPQIEATKAQKAQIQAIFSAAATLRHLTPKQPIQYALVTPADMDTIASEPGRRRGPPGAVGTSAGIPRHARPDATKSTAQRSIRFGTVRRRLRFQDRNNVRGELRQRSQRGGKRSTCS